MSDALYQKEIHLATHLRHSPEETDMVSLSNRDIDRLKEIKKELDKHAHEITSYYREKLMKEQQEIFRKLSLSSERGMITHSSERGIITRIGTLANLQNPYII